MSLMGAGGGGGEGVVDCFGAVCEAYVGVFVYCFGAV